NPSNPHGISIILLFWGVTASLFIGMNKYILINRVIPTNDQFWLIAFVTGNYELEPRPLYRNVPEGANASIDTLPGGNDPYIVKSGEALPPTFVNDYGETIAHTLSDSPPVAGS
ncbi:MAG: hypothetical protein ACKVGY_04950, partial [Candidatus Poseidoniales archaeon]